MNATSHLWTSREGAQLLFHLPVPEKHNMDARQAGIKYSVDDLPQAANCGKDAVIEGNWCLGTYSNRVAQLSRAFAY